MYFDKDDEERDPFELFGQADDENDDELLMDEGEDLAMDDDIAVDDITLEEEPDTHELEPTVVEPQRQAKVKTGFSWAGFAGGLAALVWIAAAIGGPLSYFGIDAAMAMDPAMQAGMIALAFGPALLFWVAASAAGEALKARRLAVELTRIAQEARSPVEAGENDARRLTDTVRTEIETLNDAVTAALDRLTELEAVAQRNAVVFGEAVAASRHNTQEMSDALTRERDALAELNGDLKGQTETMAHSIGRQIRLMREASKLVKTEVAAAEDALETHLSSFTASAGVLGERTIEFHAAADSAAAASASLNGAMTEMLDGLTEATRLTETAKKSTEQAVMAANETAGAVRETTRAAVYEAKRAAQLIRAEAQAMQESAAETMARMQQAAQSTRTASEESQAAAERHAASIEQRLTALANAAGSKKAARKVERVVEAMPAPVMAEATTLHAAANAAVARGGARPQVRTETVVEEAPRRVFKGFGSWGNFMPQRTDEAPVAANEDDDSLELARFEREMRDPDADLKSSVLDLVASAGVDLAEVLHAADLERIARSSREGANARRRAVVDAAPGSVTRIARLVRRNSEAHVTASTFRARPDLTKSERKGEGKELVRAYLLIDAALV